MKNKNSSNTSLILLSHPHSYFTGIVLSVHGVCPPRRLYQSLPQHRSSIGMLTSPISEAIVIGRVTVGIPPHKLKDFFQDKFMQIP
jgi:hypothetical protein